MHDDWRGLEPATLKFIARTITLALDATGSALGVAELREAGYHAEAGARDLALDMEVQADLNSGL